MNIVTLSLMIICGIVCAFIHKGKGYQFATGFLWGFFFFIIGLIVVLLEKDKEENDKKMAENKSLSMAQWLAIFLGVGIVLIIIFLIIISRG